MKNLVSTTLWSWSLVGCLRLRWRLKSRPRLMFSGTTMSCLVTSVCLFLFTTIRHPSLSIVVLVSDLKNCLTGLKSCFSLGLCPASSLTLAKSLSLLCRNEKALLLLKGRGALPLRISLMLVDLPYDGPLLVEDCRYGHICRGEISAFSDEYVGFTDQRV